MLTMNNTTTRFHSFYSTSPSMMASQNTTTFGEIFVLPNSVRLLFYVLQCVLAVFGLAGNTLVILSVRCNSHMKKSISNLFITNLAIADICILVIAHTFILGLEIRDFQWPFGEFVCRALLPFSDSFYGVSIWSIVAISFHRYQGIVRIMNAQLSTRKARLIMAATWVFSIIVIALPLWVIIELQPDKICEGNWPNRESFATYHVFLAILFYFLPLALILYFYFRIRISLKQSSGFHRQMTKSSSQSALRDDIAKRIRRNATALRVLTPVVVVFFVTMLPFTVFRLLIVFADMASFPYTRVVFFGCIIFLLANSSANPVIYTIVSPEFRRSFMKFLGMKKRLGKDNSTQRRHFLTRNASEFFFPQNTMKSETEDDSCL